MKKLKAPLSCTTFRLLIKKALRSYHDLNNSESKELLQIFLLRSKRAEINQQNPVAVSLEINKLLQDQLSVYKELDPKKGHLLEQRFINGKQAREVALEFKDTEFKETVNVNVIRHWQKAAIDAFSQLIWEKEQDARSRYILNAEEKLGAAPYSQLFGVEDAATALVEKLLAPDQFHILGINGIGGIGKTSLAYQVVKDAISHLYFDHIVWYRVDPQMVSMESPTHIFEQFVHYIAQKVLPHTHHDGDVSQLTNEIQRVFKQNPYLVVIDNLEDDETTEFFVKQIEKFIEPTKFLLTSRAPTRNTSRVYSYTLTDLAFNNTVDLIRSRAREIGLKGLESLKDDQAQILYDRVGGNPLAIKIIVALAKTFSIKHILEDLKKANSTEILDLYTHVYRKAWAALSGHAQQLLEMMPTISEIGGVVAQLQAVSRLSEGEVTQAIQELVGFSLLEVRGTVWERRYGIHRLTEAFIKAEIIFGDDE